MSPPEILFAKRIPNYLEPGQVRILEGVITQGRSDSDNWVTEYTVSYSSTKKHWSEIKKDDQSLVSKFVEHCSVAMGF